MLLLVFGPVFASMFSSTIANRVHLIYPVIISAYGALGALIGWIKMLEQWRHDKEIQQKE